jgi:superfamily II DNA/RNA helicase
MSDNLISNFNGFNLGSKLLGAIQRLGFEVPTEIQAKSIPLILEGKDVVGESATGSGKTLAFGCGAIECCLPKQGLQALILVPTRELAEQVTKSINELNVNKRFKVLQIYGGVSINPQIDGLRFSEIVVATPGRLKDHIQRGTIDLSKLKLLVLDEADRMLDMGFIPDVEDIVKRCPKKRQTLLFSATFPPAVRVLTKKFLSNPVNIKVDNQVDAKLLKQVYYDVRRGEKLSLLVHLIKNEASDRIMVFCNTRMNSDLVHQNLVKNNVKASVLHGGFTQASRTKVIDNFKSGKCKVLVCTDVAARGIHVDDVSHVYNYDMAKDPNDYVHRIGRTARAGSEGLVVNLVSDLDHDNFSRIFSNYDFKIEKLSPPADVVRIKFDISKPKGEDRVDSNRRGSSQHRKSNFRGNNSRSSSGRSDSSRNSSGGRSTRSSGGSGFTGRRSDSRPRRR